MTKVVKEFLLDHATGEVSVEYDDNSTSKYNLSNAVTATKSAQGMAIDDGVASRGFVIAGMSGGVPTGNFS